MKKIDVSKPKRMYWKHQVASVSHCPECQGPLVEEFQSYLFCVKNGREMDSFATGTDGGFFCPQCPVVVLDGDKFDQMANVTGQSGQWAVAGIINLDAVEDEYALLDTDENPIPLVEFLRARPPIKQVQRESKKIGRNDPCPCGSGKKYKKCCGTVKLLFP